MADRYHDWYNVCDLIVANIKEVVSGIAPTSYDNNRVRLAEMLDRT